MARDPGRRCGRTGGVSSRRRSGGHPGLRRRHRPCPSPRPAQRPGTGPSRRSTRSTARDFTLLSSWQQHLLGAPPPRFRTSPAFAKGSRERYGIGPDTPGRFDACLAESASDVGRPLGLTARAARAYLGVCFFHPFDDGNARSAFLTLVFVLARAGIALDGVSLLRRITFEADAPQDPLILVRYINVHLTETRRRSATSTGSASR
ncbi:Fic family protein [Streptomyces sp. ZAF1911]|uniref:Fic family protein n=1 Tax=Streptomyces sp. ZAF1911 TaxID=2944129 RepID=UPI00237B6F38|nr:Fic family protein [Streptomyces sp. ZAF1911]MDD9380861.1 Fic family protein [Streptomyces sp. ZAF1911]